MRRDLGFSVAEWDALPWWQQKLYIDEWIVDHTPQEAQEPPVQVVDAADLDLPWNWQDVKVG